jgi:histidyl-tRNA synthetase
LKAKTVLIIGDEEMKSGVLLARDMATKEQRNIREEALLESQS